MWFQEELPYTDNNPDIDLGSIKGSSANVFPREFNDKILPKNEEHDFREGEFFKRFGKRIETNFDALGHDIELKDRRVEGALACIVKDFAKQKHLLP